MLARQSSIVLGVSQFGFVFALLAIIGLGYLLKRMNVVTRESGNVLIRVVLYLFLPATIFHAFAEVALSGEPLFGMMFAMGFAVSGTGYLAGYLVTRVLDLPIRSQGTLIIACGALNIGLFVYPFFIAFVGVEGLVYAAIFDLGQAPFIYFFAVMLAKEYGRRAKVEEAGELAASSGLKRFLANPLIWAIAAGLVVNISGLGRTDIYSTIKPLITILSDATVPIILILLGIFIESKIERTKAILSVVMVRFGLSTILASVFVLITGVTGLARLSIFAASVVPSAVLTLIYSNEEGLDSAFAASAVSITILIGIVVTPAIFILLG